jgi:hypothetical protein
MPPTRRRPPPLPTLDFLVKLAVLISAVLLVAASPAGARPSFLARGFADSAFFAAPDGDRALANARSAGASFVRLGVTWRAVAPSGRRKPMGFKARDPADPHYSWSETDRAVRAAAAAGLEPLFNIAYAPDWAEGSGRPRRRTSFTRPGVWRPQPRELAAFVTAASRRYGGSFADPQQPGRRLPRVRSWQIWNEPNLWPFLQPQWKLRRGRWIRAGAAHYRKMLNASYRALKRVDRSNRVIVGGLAPFGDLKPSRNGGRVAPASFLRGVLCLRGRLSLHRACRRASANFDVYAFHPYSLGGPRRSALNPDDTTIPDARKLTRVVRAGLRLGTARPRRPKELWVTEMGWDTRPPNPHGLRPHTQARYLNDSLFVLWRSGVSRVTNLLMRDSGGKRARRLIDPQRRQSGVFFRGRTVALDRRKPSFFAMRFPFVVSPLGGGMGRVWGVPPCPLLSCTVVIERRTQGGWTPLSRVLAQRDRVFLRTVRVNRRAVLRARIDGSRISSLTTLPRRL